MKKRSIIFIHAFFAFMLLNTFLIPFSGALADVLSEQGCGKVFGLLVQGDSRKDFKIDVDNMVKVIQLDLKGTVIEYRPPAEGEGIVNASGEIQGMLWDLNTGMGSDDTLIVSIHTHGEAHMGGPPFGGTGNGKLKLQLGYDENGLPQHSTEWQPAEDLPWSEVTAGKIIVNIDTCYAEASARELNRVLSRPEFADKEILILAATNMEEVGGGENEVLKVKDYEIPAGGYFTNAIIKVMRDRGIKNLASPSAVTTAYDEIARLAKQYSTDAKHVGVVGFYGTNPRHFPINIGVIEKIDPKTTVKGNEVMISGRHFGYPLPEGEYQNDPNENLQVFFCQTQSTATPQPCYRGLTAEIVRRTNTQIVIKVPEEIDTILSQNQPVYVCINNNGKLTSSLFLGPEGEFTLQYPPEIAAISPDVVLKGSYFGVKGKNFGDSSFAILDDSWTIEPSWVNDDYMLVHLPPPNTIGFIEGKHTLKVKLGTAESESAPFTVVLQHPPGEALPAGWSITVSQLSMTDAADGEISLLEAMKLANGTLGRDPQTHEDCEITGDCQWHQREEDFISGFPGPGGKGFEDTILVKSDLSGGIMAVGGAGLPPVDNSDKIDFKNIVLDGAGTAGPHGLLLDNISKAKIRNVTLRHFLGDGVHIRNNSMNHEFTNVNIDSAGGHGIFIDGNSVQNTFTYPDQDPFDTFVPNIYNTGGHGIYLKGGANRNSFRNVFIADAGGSGIFLEGHAEGNHLDKMVVTNPALHGLHLSGSMVRLNRAYRHKTGKLTDLEAAWDLEDIYETAGGYGILIDNGANNNILGPNQVFNNTQGGIRLDGAGTEFNVIGKEYRNRPFNEGAILPTLVYDNQGHGIHISNGASFNTIELMNVAGSIGDGVLLEGSDTAMNRISGIWTGFFYFYKALTEPLSKPNTGNSVHITSGANWNMVGGYSIVRNNFSNDALNGVLIEGAETHSNILHHTDIGRTPYITRIAEGNVFGRQLAGVGKSGIAVTNGAHDNTIGSMDTDWRVHVDASPDAGILIDNSDDNLVLGCFLGSPFEYIEFTENEKNRIGIHIRNKAKGNRIGRIGPMLGPDPSPASWTGIVDNLNQITHAREAGVWIENAGGSVDDFGNRVKPNVLHNNYIESDGIGLKISGDSRVNDIGGWLGGPTGDFVNVFESFTQENNTIEGKVAGIKIVDVKISNPDERNRILNNTINSQWDEQDPPTPIDLSLGPPDGVGILVTGNSSGNIIGESFEAPNQIYMNRVGVYIDGAPDNTVRGNKIGSVWVPNSIAGIVIRNGQANRIGGRLFEDANILEGNGLLAYGINGPTANPQASGILIIGGQKNTVHGNEILDTSGDGIFLIDTTENTIGGPRRLNGNMITNSSGNGIAINGVDSTGNIVQNNLIGMNWQGEARGNGADGIDLSGGASGNFIGGKGSITVAGNTIDLYAPNTIAHNTITGIHVSGPGTIGNAILYNSIHGNVASGISNVNAGNDELPPPTNMLYELGVIKGEVTDMSIVPAGSVVNVFWDAGSQGEIFLGETKVETDGTWSLSGILPAPFWLAGTFTATVTHVSTGSTSGYAVASAKWDRDFNLFRADGRAPGQQTVTFGHGDIPVLVVGVIAVEEGVQVNRLTLTSAGSLLDNTQLDGVSIYRDEDKDGRITHEDRLMAGPFIYNADNGQVDLNLADVIVEANDSQQWIIVYHTSKAVEEGTTFSASIPNALAVDAEFISSKTPAIPQGPFPAASDQFTVVIAKKFTLADVILILQMLAGMEPASIIYKEADINNDGKIGLHEAIWALQELCGMRGQIF